MYCEFRSDFLDLKKFLVRSAAVTVASPFVEELSCRPPSLLPVDEFEDWDDEERGWPAGGDTGAG